MKFFFCFLAIWVIWASTDAAIRDKDKDRRLARGLWQKLSRKVDKRSECLGLGDVCTGVAWAKCCGEAVCYREEGIQFYNPFKEGVCVTCIRDDLICQLDSQCCSPSVCHREDKFDTNGACGPKRSTGGYCHENDNCISGDCNLDGPWYTDGSCT